MPYLICFCLLLMYICLHYCREDKYSFNEEKRIILITYIIAFIVSTVLECLNEEALMVIVSYIYMILMTGWAIIELIFYLNIQIRNKLIIDNIHWSHKNDS